MKIEHDPADLAALARPLTLLGRRSTKLVAPNRIVYQPMEGNDAGADGGPSPVTLRRYRERAHGRAGIDFVEALAVSRDGRARERQLVLCDGTRRGFTRLVTEYREVNPATPLLFQLTHSGRFALDPVTPYPIEGSDARLLADGDLVRIREDFVRAAGLAFECGADGIDFKHCHGYLGGALLGPANGPRPGWSYGGESLEDRARFGTETLARMMEEVPPDRFLYTVRLSAFEGIPGGFGSVGVGSAEEDESLAELTAFARRLQEAGVGLVNQSSGVPEITPHLVRQTHQAPLLLFHHRDRAAAIKAAVSIPVVGSGYSYARDGANRLPGDDPAKKSLVALGGSAIREGRVDLVGVGRQSFADPRFAAKLLEGRFGEIRWDDACSRCAIALRSGIHAGCVTHDPYYRELFRKLRP